MSYLKAQEVLNGPRGTYRLKRYIKVQEIYKVQEALKNEPQIYFRTKVWAKCLEILYPSLSTSLWLEVGKVQAWAKAVSNFQASFLSYTFKNKFTLSTFIVNAIDKIESGFWFTFFPLNQYKSDTANA